MGGPFAPQLNVFRSPLLFIGLILTSLVVLKLQGDRLLIRSQAQFSDVSVGVSHSAGNLPSDRRLAYGVEEGAVELHRMMKMRVSEWGSRPTRVIESQKSERSDKQLDEGHSLPQLVVESITGANTAVRTPSSETNGGKAALPLRIERLR